MPTFEEIAQANTPLPSRLYRYQSSKLEYIAETIIKNTLHFSTPATFNDPFDCKICIDASGTLPQKITKIRSIISNRFPNWSKIKVGKEVKRWLKEGRQNEIAEKKANSAILGIGICCLTERNDNILMWSHYAASHSGVCFEFSPSDECELFINTSPVSYKSEAPIFDIYKSDTEKKVLSIITTKSKDWEYEKEWRIWLTHNVPGNFKFTPNLLTGIIFGCRATPKFITEVKEIVKNRELPLNLYQATEVYGQFSLDITPL